MYFSAVTAFRVPRSLREQLSALDAALAERALKPIGPQELHCEGFVPPMGSETSALVHAVGPYHLVCLASIDRILPPGAIDEALDERLAQYLEREGKAPNGKERRRLKDELVFEMIPRAFSKRSYLYAFFDLDTGTLVVDTSSRKAAERVVSAVRLALGSFPAKPLNIERMPRQILTSWLAGEAPPESLSIGDEAVLKDPVERGAIIKAQRQDLVSEEISHHLQAGKQCAAIGLVYADRASFVLDESLAVKKLKFLDLAEQPLLEQNIESVAQEMDARFAITAGVVSGLLAQLFDTFAVSSAEPLFAGEVRVEVVA